MKSKSSPPKSLSARATCAAIGMIAAMYLCGSSSHGATITWGSPGTISGGNDVNTTGSLFDAASNGGTGTTSQTVNGVTFDPFVTNGTGLTFNDTSGNMTLSVTSGSINGGSNFGNLQSPFASLSPASYQTLLSSASFSSNIAAMTLTINNLTIGQGYLVELWANYSDLALPVAPVSETVSAGNNTSLTFNTTNSTGGVGQFVVGTFVANNASEQITFTNGNMAYPNALLNAAEVRAVPEMSSTRMLFAGVAFLFATMRLRSRRA